MAANYKAFKKREREIKNTKIYTGSPFLKDYVQSFANKQRVSLRKITKISSIQYKTLAPNKSTLYLLAHNLLHTTTVAKQCRTLLHTTTVAKQCRALLHKPTYTPYAKWVTKTQLQITKGLWFATKQLTIQKITIQYQ